MLFISCLILAKTNNLGKINNIYNKANLMEHFKWKQIKRRKSFNKFVVANFLSTTDDFF